MPCQALQNKKCAAGAAHEKHMTPVATELNSAYGSQRIPCEKSGECVFSITKKHMAIPQEIHTLKNIKFRCKYILQHFKCHVKHYKIKNAQPEPRMKNTQLQDCVKTLFVGCPLRTMRKKRSLCFFLKEKTHGSTGIPKQRTNIQF